MSYTNHALTTYPLTENVPARLKSYIVWNWIVAIAFCAITVFTYADHYWAVKTVGVDAAPSVFAAHNMKNHVLNMDGNLANFLIARPGDNYSAITGKDGYDRWRGEVEDQLVVAAKNITFDGEKEQLTAVQQALGEFTDAVAAARVKHESGDFAYLAYYRTAQNVLETKLLPAANKLDEINGQQLDTSYRNQRSISWLLSGANLFAGLGLLWMIMNARRYVRSRFKRRHNAALTAALFLAGVFTFYTTLEYAFFDSHFKAAKVDDYDSVVSLLDARASAFELKAAGSSWLLDPPMRQQKYEKDFAARQAEVANLKNGKTFADAVAEAQNGAGIRKNFVMQAAAGSLADEIKNITFDGEKEAAVATLRLFGAYVDAENRVRVLETSGQHTDAVDMAIGSLPGQVGSAFGAFDQSLEQTLQINMKMFKQDVEAAQSDIGFIWWLALIQAATQVGLFLVGMWPRQKEFV